MTYARLMTVVPPTPAGAQEQTADARLALIRAGDAAAFEQLFHDTYPALVSFAQRYAGDRARAEELVQDLFLDLWKTRFTWDVRGSLRGYLFGALRNRALNLRRRDAIEEGWTGNSPQDAILALHSTPAPISDQLIADEDHAAVRRAFALLPERCRLAMHLRWRDGMSYAEISDALGITVKSVENHLARGLKAVRERIHGA